jgi:hypothetical protein
MAAALAAALTACDEPRPTPDASADADQPPDADRDVADADHAQDADPDLDAVWDADPDLPDAEDEAESEMDALPPHELTCNEDGTATICLVEEDSCTTIGPCTLGCDEEAGACYVPSNVSPELLDRALGDLDLAGVGATAAIDTDTGAVTGEGGTIRAAGPGVDAATGTSFAVVTQEGGPELGVLSVGRFGLPAGTTMTVSGTRPLVILAGDEVTIDGVIDVGAQGMKAGPGGYDGGDIGARGNGPSPGEIGELEKTCLPFCATGGGGGGFGGIGGDGGAVVWAVADAGSGTAQGGRGGRKCGTAWLTPLFGGSGGAGGTRSEEEGRLQEPGPGGGGGGAIQISSAVSITIGGGITAPGDGGRETQRGGGAGGGAGGAVLLESPSLTLRPGAFLAANGGGGGGGDCT